MPTSSLKKILNGVDYFSGTLNLQPVYGLHQPRRSCEDRRMHSSASSGDHLTTTTVNRFLCQQCVKNLYFGTTNWFLTERSLPSRPLKSLHNAGSAGVKKLLIDFTW